MNDPKISIIVAVYNAENYLNRCINSLLGQTFKDFEVLLIDDGSKDNSGQLCDAYAVKDSRIKVFHKQNEGVSSARKIGISMALGKYIQFVDSDDWLEYNCLEENFRIAETNDVDIVISDFHIDSDRTSIIRTQNYTGNLICDIFEGNIFGALWNKFIRKSLIDQSGVTFGYNLNFCEDLVFLCELWKTLNGNISVLLNSAAYYHYCNNTASLTKNNSLDKIKYEERYIDVIKKILPELPEKYIRINKFSVKWAYLKLGILNYQEYHSLYEDLLITKLPIPIIKKLLLIMGQYRIGYSLLRYNAKLIWKR